VFTVAGSVSHASAGRASHPSLLSRLTEVDDDEAGKVVGWVVVGEFARKRGAVRLGLGGEWHMAGFLILRRPLHRRTSARARAESGLCKAAAGTVRKNRRCSCAARDTRESLPVCAAHRTNKRKAAASASSEGHRRVVLLSHDQHHRQGGRARRKQGPPRIPPSPTPTRKARQSLREIYPGETEETNVPAGPLPCTSTACKWMLYVKAAMIYHLPPAVSISQHEEKHQPGRRSERRGTRVSRIVDHIHSGISSPRVTIAIFPDAHPSIPLPT
jgi:hypothetical protein